MPKRKKSIDKTVNCIIPEPLSHGSTLRDMINRELLEGAVTKLKPRGRTQNRIATPKKPKPLTDLQYSTYLRIIDLIASKQDLTYGHGYVQLNSEIMLDNLGSRYKDVLRHLINLNIIDVKKNKNGAASYSRDKHESKEYRLSDTFRHEELILVQSFRRVFTNRPKKDIVDSNTVNLLADVTGFPEYSYLKGWLHKLRFDQDAVKADCENWFQSGALIKGEPFTEIRRELYLRSLEAFNDDEVRFSIKLSGKIYTGLTSSPKVLRQRLRLDGYNGTLIQSDVTSTHVLLAVPAMREYKAQLTDPEAIYELDMVESIIADKSFYKAISEQIRSKGVTIIDEKEDFIRKVGNAKIYDKSAYRTAFNELYPAYSEFLNSVRKKKSFTARMNPLEAHLFNNRIAHRVCTELGSNIFLGGIFDALIYKQEDSQGIQKIIEEEVFRASGLPNMVKHTTLAEESQKCIKYPEKPLTAPVVNITQPDKEEENIIITTNNQEEEMTIIQPKQSVRDTFKFSKDVAGETHEQKTQRVTREALAYMEAITPELEAELEAAHAKWYQEQQEKKNSKAA